jgi:CheY-like chemotaxis protein
MNLSIAGDGAQALAMLADERFKPDLIILDLNLPVNRRSLPLVLVMFREILS